MNLLAENREVVELYLLGLKTSEKLDFTFGINLECTEVFLGRNLPILAKNKKLAIKHVFDRDTLSMPEPSLEQFKALFLHPLKNLVVNTLFRFDDQFYQDKLK